MLALAVGIAAQDRVRIGIPLRRRLPPPVDKGVAALRRVNGIHHDADVSAGGVLHAGRHFDAAGREPVLLVLDGPCADRHVRQKVVQVLMVLRVEHLVGAGEPGPGRDLHVELPDRDDPLEHIRPLLRIRLVEQALVAVSGRSRLIRIYPRNDQDPVLHFFLHSGEPLHIVEHAVLVVRGAGSDDQQELVALSREDLLDLRVAFFLDPAYVPCEGIHLLHFHRYSKFSLKFHIHG